MLFLYLFFATFVACSSLARRDAVAQCVSVIKTYNLYSYCSTVVDVSGSGNANVNVNVNVTVNQRISVPSQLHGFSSIVISQGSQNCLITDCSLFYCDPCRARW